MKDYHIYLFKDIGNLKETVGFINVREQFFNNSFIEEPFVLFQLSKDFSQRKEILGKKIEKHLVKNSEHTVSDFSKKMQVELQAIIDYSEKENISLSWLDSLQIAILLHNKEINESLIKDSISKIFEFHSLIKKTY
jgi:hypothetical protein